MPRILGQDKAIEALGAALSSGRVHHAWIFAGPRGVGKFTTAVEFARTLLDPEADGAFPIQDRTSKIQNLIDAGTHPDLHVIRKEMARDADTRELRDRKLRNIPLDLLRELIIGGRTGDDRIHEAPAYRTAALGHGKVFIIDEAELIDLWGQNTLLKTLEEPPHQTYFILVASQPDLLLPTIRSRCQLVPFAPLPPAAMKTWLDQSGLSLSPDERRWIETFAGGSPGMAQLAAQYGLHRWSQTLAPMLAKLSRGQFPSEMGAAMGELVEEFALAWVKANANASKDAANKDAAGHMFALLSWEARQRLSQDASRGEDPARWLRAIDCIVQAEQAVDSNVNAKLVLENLVAQLAREPRESFAAV